MGKTVFITGAAGFIGFHLASHLIERGDRVIGYDNFNDYYSPQLKRNRALKLKEKGVLVIEGDITDFQQLQRLVVKHQPTHLAHLAAQAGVRYSLSHPHLYSKVNIEGFLNILEICRAFPNIKLIYASSSSVYGLNRKVPFSVKDRTDAQASLYGVTKKSNELMAQTYHHLYGIAAVGLRFFTVYGPWGRPDMAYYSFTKAILEGSPIHLYNNGNMWRDFTYIDDIIQGTVSAIDLAQGNDIFNLGHNQPEELGRLVALIEKETGREAVKVMMPMQAGDVITTFADIEESTAKLSFIPRVSLEEGIARFVDWYRCYA